MRSSLVALFALSLPLAAAVKIEKMPYRGWPNCYRISNGQVELIVTTDVGPRVIRYGFPGGQNLFKEYDAQMGKSGEATWQARGGHRIWMAPEDGKLSYALDNSPIQFESKGDTVVLTGPVEKETGLQKQMIVRLAAQGSDVEVTQRITNKGSNERYIATWALTMMAPGGAGIAVFPPRGSHEAVLGPTNPLTMWAYTDFSDPRWRFTSKYVVLRMDPSVSSAQKTGLFNTQTAGAYLLGSDLFLKRATAHDPARQPDFGCSYETFTNNEFLEMETLGELTHLKPGDSTQHIEHWSLHSKIHLDSWTDQEIDRVLLPLLKP